MNNLYIYQDRLTSYVNQYLSEKGYQSKEFPLTMENEDTGAMYYCDDFVSAFDALIEMFWFKPSEN